MAPTRRRSASLIALYLATAASACGGDVTLPDEGNPAAIAILSGDTQSGSAGAALAQPLVVKVTDATGRPVQSAAVAFTIDAGGGQVAPGSVQTGTDGTASAIWTLGAAAGPQQVQAKVSGPATLTVLFHASASSGTGSVLQIVSGDNQTGPVRSALADSLVVKVGDALGNPVAGVLVQWAALGGGEISPTAVVTGADGLAAAERVLGTASGTQTAEASAAGLTTVTFTHTAVAANPTNLIIVSGNGQTGGVGAPLADSLTVRLEDDNGNGVGGKAITWVVTPGSGSVSPGTSVTSPNGFAQTEWTLGRVAGSTNTVTAVFSGLQVRFTATSGVGAPAKLAFVQPPVNTRAGTVITPSVRVAVQDGDGITVTAGQVAVTIAIASNPSAGTLSGTRTVESVNGVAVFPDLSIDNVGPDYTLDASASGLTDATSPQFDINKVPTTLAITGDQPDPSTAGDLVTVQWNLASPGTGAITGNVVVSVNGGTPAEGCSVAAALGAGSCAFPMTSTGTRTIVASYAGDANHSAAPNNAHVSHEVLPPANVPPTANDDAFTTQEDASLDVNQGNGVLKNDDDPDRAPESLVARNASDPLHGTVVLSDNGSFTYTPDADYNGPDSFTYEAFDGAAAATATVTISVAAVNDAPSFTAGPNQSASVFGLSQTVPGWATAISAGPPDEPQTVEFEVSTDDSRFLISPQVDGSGTLTYTPNPLTSPGDVTVTLHARDSEGALSPDQSFTITLTTP